MDGRSVDPGADVGLAGEGASDQPPSPASTEYSQLLREIQEDLQRIRRDEEQSGGRQPHQAAGATIFKLTIVINRHVRIGPYWNSFTSIDDDDAIAISRPTKLLLVEFLVSWYGLDWRGFLAEMRRKEAEVRRCYDTVIFPGLPSSKLHRTLLLDGCFLLFLIIPRHRSGQSSDEEQLIAAEHERLYKQYITPRIKDITLDLLGIENQIPFFVVDDLLKFTVLGTDGEFDRNRGLVKSRALELFADVYPKHNPDKRVDRVPDFHHLVDLFWWSRSPVDVLTIGDDDGIVIDMPLRIPSLTELQESATVLRKGHRIAFHRRFMGLGGVITLPTIRIDRSTLFVFEDLTMFEKLCAKAKGGHFTAYVTCLGHLVQEEKDVRLLRKSGVVANTDIDIGDDKVLEFFRILARESEGARKPQGLYDLYRQVVAHHHSRVGRSYGQLLNQYCSNPWITVSVVGAVLIFVLTFLQTLFSILSYKVSV